MTKYPTESGLQEDEKIVEVMLKDRVNIVSL